MKERAPRVCFVLCRSRGKHRNLPISRALCFITRVNAFFLFLLFFFFRKTVINVPHNAIIVISREILHLSLYAIVKHRLNTLNYERYPNVHPIVKYDNHLR